MRSSLILRAFVVWAGLTVLASGCATVAAQDGAPREVPILQKWQGDYPVTEINRLPEGQREARVGYIGDATTFAAVWQAFRSGEPVPQVDFSRDLVVFARNVQFYNRTSIFKVILKDGVAEVLAMETMSALPVEDKVAMALAVVPRVGVEFIQAGVRRIPVTAGK